MTLKEFQTLYNDQRSKMNPPRHKVTFSLMKSKITKKREQKWGVDGNGVPVLISEVNAESKQVVDTNGLTKLYQAMWSFFLGVELKRISSEGNYRHGIGFIKSTNKGIADLMGGYNGKVYYLEMKQKAEKLLPSQIAFKAWVESFGGEYHIVKGFDDMYSLIKTIHSPQSSLFNGIGDVDLGIKLNTMNDKIKAILEKHRIQTDPKLLGVSDLNNAIIEICEEQKKECAEIFSEGGLLYKAIGELIINSKNIAQ